jgi:hypothetical protein
MGRRRVLAFPWRVLARSGVSGRHGARRVLANSKLSWVNDGYRQVCGSEARLLDMVGVRLERSGERVDMRVGWCSRHGLVLSMIMHDHWCQCLKFLTGSKEVPWVTNSVMV